MPPRIGACCSPLGHEAVEAALKLGRAAAGRSRILSTDKGFHGLTLGSLSVNGGAEWSSRFGPLLPDCYRVPFNDLAALEALRREDVGVFLVEPVQGKGVNLPDPDYLSGAQELCRRYGTLFALDEVQTGFGRTGRMFALEHWGLEPDIVTISKSLSGGYLPVGACLMSKEVYDNVFDSLEHAVSHGSTFAPNDLAMAAGLATLPARAGRPRSGRELGASGRASARADPAVRRALRSRAGRARARSHVGDRVPGAGRREQDVAHARAGAARHLQPARRRPALLGPCDLDSDGRPQHERAQGHSVADREPG